MPEIRCVQVVNKKGLHARAAAKFVKCAEQFLCEINVICLPEQGLSADSFENEDCFVPDEPVSARSILGLMMLGVQQGAYLKLIANGDDAAAALDALEALIAQRFGESE